VTEYTITVARPARRELEALDASLVHRIVSAIDGLASEPRPRGCRKLRGESNLWRVRIGEYRVIYAVYDERRLVDIIAVRHRSKAYE
jgi:mRNA interferase RelE/StbE